MDVPYFFMPGLPADDIVTLEEGVSHHIHVLRMKTSDKVKLTDGSGQIAEATIVEMHKKRCMVKVDRVQQVDRPAGKISIAISLLKNASRLEWFLEKATELGVHEIWLLQCDRTEKQHFKQNRAHQILVSAMLQSQQAWLPLLHPPAPYPEVVNQLRVDVKLIAHCLPGEKKHLKAYSANPSTGILIGPEGDFTPTEIQMALDNGFETVSLGNTRLRTETAGMVAATLLCL